MRRDLEAGTTLVLDRYAFSGVAFSSVKPGMDAEWCRAADIGLPAPDIVFFMDMPVERAKQRGGFGEERYEKEEFQRKVRGAFSKLMDESWHVIDADRDRDVIHAEILAKAQQVIRERATTPLGKLWVGASVASSSAAASSSGAGVE